MQSAMHYFLEGYLQQLSMMEKTFQGYCGRYPLCHKRDKLPCDRHQQEGEAGQTLAPATGVLTFFMVTYSSQGAAERSSGRYRASAATKSRAACRLVSSGTL
jgi:hypothetical protein